MKLSNVQQYAQQHPYKAAALAVTGLAATAAVTSLLYIGISAAFNKTLVCQTNYFTGCRTASFGEKFSAGTSATADAVKAAGATVAAAATTAASTVKTAANKASGKIADFFMGKQGDNASCLNFTNTGNAPGISNNCPRPGFKATWFGK